MKPLSLISYIILLLFSCSTPQQKIPEIVINYEAPEAQFNLSEIADGLEIIPLETNDSVLISMGPNICIGDHYIVVKCDKAIYQFTREGKYIRKMLSHGRAPEEFISYTSQLIDNQKGLYFMTSDLYNELFIYDLNEGKLLKKKSLPFPMKLLKVNNDTLICYPELVTQKSIIPYSLCTLNFEGDILQTLKDTIKDPIGSPISVNCLTENKILLKTQESDTVYRVENWKKIPVYTLKGKFPEDPEAIVEFSFIKEDSINYYFKEFPVSYTYNEEGKRVGMFSYSSKLFRVNKQTLKSEAIKLIYIDSLDIKQYHSDLKINETISYFTLSPSMIQEILQNKSAKGLRSPILQKICNEISEDDNPLIFIAKNK